MMRNVARISMVAALCLASVSAVARHRVTEEEGERACKPDVFRLCHEFIPNHSEIAACLKKNRKLLRPACRKIMSR